MSSQFQTVEDLDGILVPLRRDVDDARRKLPDLEGDRQAEHLEFIAESERDLLRLESKRRLLVHKFGEPEPPPEPEAAPHVETAPPPPPPKPRAERGPPLSAQPKRSSALFWEKQPGETSAQYAAFAAYRDLGITRSIVKAVESVGKSPSNRRRNWERWSSENMWVARAEAFDAERERKRRLKREEDIVEALNRHRRAASLMQTIAVERMNMYRLDARGEPPLNALRYLEAGLREEKLALGVPGDIGQLEFRGQAATSSEDFDDLRRLDNIDRAVSLLRRI